MEGILVNLSTTIKAFKAAFDTKITDARALKLDNLNATVSSRASQATADAAYNNTTSLKSSVANIQADTSQLLKSPTGGGTDEWSGIVTVSSQGYKVTVSGSGVLRLLSSTTTLASSRPERLTYRLNIDGKWVSSAIDRDNNMNIAVGGIRFDSYFKIYVYSIPFATQNILYSYTLGD